MRRSATAAFEALREHAAGLPGATTDIKWGADWVASVGSKMFFVVGPWPGPVEGCSFKVDADRFIELTGLPGIAPAPYLARARWVKVDATCGLPLPDLRALVSRSHALVLAALPKKTQRELLA
ncbi:MmcQ/YjbR family DNA-binding protein [Rivibacter subsaxonicus]|uniref:Putative DNA-binding protein (MmcQ/YjbR family) n=1 Tax=Rivibacter subsaxonicus TaxID=457575 RepID=A0A4Q7VZ68_9BURK|nr:MmcQ/YjbR family DNA-binding protein [Rivibacter subsaxonicus]RZU02030.1 putative DNA-binding protein (MmcQ/YjbR family) [Rivibacter subsaxonicus]